MPAAIKPGGGTTATTGGVDLGASPTPQPAIQRYVIDNFNVNVALARLTINYHLEDASQNVLEAGLSVNVLDPQFTTFYMGLTNPKTAVYAAFQAALGITGTVL